MSNEMPGSQQFDFSSPSPSRIRKVADSLSTCRYPADTSPLATWQELQPMQTPQRRRNGGNTDELCEFFMSALTTEVLDNAESRGYLFGYKYNQDKPYARDLFPLKEHNTVIGKHLQTDPLGLWVKSEVGEALKHVQKERNRNISSTMSIRLQAAHYCRYFSDLRSIGGDKITGSRLQPHVKTLLELMRKPSDLLIYYRHVIYGTSQLDVTHTNRYRKCSIRDVVNCLKCNRCCQSHQSYLDAL